MGKHDVTVVGCGLMGAAIARAFARNGLSVAAWNRTHEKAEALASGPSHVDVLVLGAGIAGISAAPSSEPSSRRQNKGRRHLFHAPPGKTHTSVSRYGHLDHSSAGPRTSGGVTPA